MIDTQPCCNGVVLARLASVVIDVEWHAPLSHCIAQTDMRFQMARVIRKMRRASPGTCWDTERGWCWGVFLLFTHYAGKQACFTAI